MDAHNNNHGLTAHRDQRLLPRNRQFSFSLTWIDNAALSGMPRPRTPMDAKPEGSDARPFRGQRLAHWLSESPFPRGMVSSYGSASSYFHIRRGLHCRVKGPAGHMPGSRGVVAQSVSVAGRNRRKLKGNRFMRRESRRNTEPFDVATAE